MKSSVKRRTVDLSAYPDLVVIYLGMRVNAWYGLKTLVGFGPRIQGAVDAAPPGLLLHETVVYSLLPPNVGMRQYWKDFDSIERWSTHSFAPSSKGRPYSSITTSCSRPRLRH